MRASLSIINICCAGLKRTSRLFSSLNLALSTSSSFSEDEVLIRGDYVDSIFGNNDDLLQNVTCISAECMEKYNDLHEFSEDKDSAIYEYHEKAKHNNELNSVTLILENCGWNLGSPNSYNKFYLDQDSIIRILNHLLEESLDAALALYFFRWSECCMGSKHGIQSVCTMIHILVAGNMNYRAVDLILCLVRKNDGEDWWLNLLLRVLHETHTERRVLVTTYSMLVDCYVKENMVNSALKLCFRMKHLNIFPSIGVCNSLLRVLLQSKQTQLAWDFLEEFQSQGLGFNASIISLFIHKYCTEGNLECGWKLLMEMRNYKINPDVVAYTMLIDSFCKMSLLREGTSILFKMTAMRISLDSVCVSSVIDGFCKAGKFEEALDILKIFSLPPNIYVYNSFISKLCTDGDMGTASNVFHEMSESGLRPDCFSLTTIIGGYCKIRDVNAALMFLGKMLKLGIQPSVTTYTTLVDGYCKSGDVDMAEHLFQNMLAESLVPDIVAYNTLMDGYGRKGLLHKAFGLLDMMKSAGVSPDIVTYNTIIHSLILRGFVSEAEGILEELIIRGFSPDVVTFTNIVGGFSKKGNFEEAFLVWFYMSEHHIKPDVVTCSALLNGYCTERRMDEANALFNKMLDVGLIPDLVLYNTLIHGFCSVASVDDACRLVDMMIEHGINPNEVTHKALVLGYEKKWGQNPTEAATFKLQQILHKYGINIDVLQC
ncbi:unnamed protein product [Ilex paraguariensis]|uniref:Pentatricopeptide repeat-containing protein n=1 Tax=Ilex paraguariensis TaxID=185542 RepID=A0ABC8RPC1_9AQUA